MVGFWIGAILGGLLLILAIIVTIANFDGPREERSGAVVGAAWAAVVLGLGIPWFFGSIFSQSDGESMVLKSITGSMVTEPSVSSGAHWKGGPWFETIPWDIRDNTLSFTGTKEEVPEASYNGGDVAGPRITVQDANDVDANFDLTLRYSIQADKVVELSKRFGSQEDLMLKVIEPEIRSTVRLVAGPFTTTDIVSKRAEIQIAVQQQLEAKWEGLGIVVESVDFQETIQPQAIKDANAANAAALIAVDTEKANRDKAIIEAEKNAIASVQLTPQVIEMARIKALQTAAEHGSVIVIPENFNGIINLPAPAVQ